MRPEDVECDCELCQQWRAEQIAKAAPRTYEQGFCDGMSANHKYPQTLMFMGYNLQQLIKIISEHEEYGFYAGEQWSEADMVSMKEKQKKMNEARQKREEFRKALADNRQAEHTTFSSKVLEAYDRVHCPELRPATKVSFNSKSYPDGLIVTIDGLLVYQK